MTYSDYSIEKKDSVDDEIKNEESENDTPQREPTECYSCFICGEKNSVEDGIFCGDCGHENRWMTKHCGENRTLAEVEEKEKDGYFYSCSNCGVENDKNDIFCWTCKNPLAKVEEKDDTAQTAKDETKEESCEKSDNDEHEDVSEPWMYLKDYESWSKMFPSSDYVWMMENPNLYDDANRKEKYVLYSNLERLVLMKKSHDGNEHEGFISWKIGRHGMFTPEYVNEMCEPCGCPVKKADLEVNPKIYFVEFLNFGNF